MRENRREISKKRGNAQSEGNCIDNLNHGYAEPQDPIPFMTGTQMISDTIQGSLAKLSLGLA